MSVVLYLTWRDVVWW